MINMNTGGRKANQPGGDGRTIAVRRAGGEVKKRGKSLEKGNHGNFYAFLTGSCRYL